MIGHVINIRGGKGGKDRVTLLSDRLQNLLGEYLEFYRPVKWLFEGEKESNIRNLVFRRYLICVEEVRGKKASNIAHFKT